MKYWYEKNYCIKKLSNDWWIYSNLIKRLEDDQLIDDTIIVLFTDHYAYGYSNVYEVKNISDVNFVQNVPFII